MHLFLKIPSGMANSVDPDQTAPEQSDLGLHGLHMLYLVSNFNLQNFKTFTVFSDKVHSIYIYTPRPDLLMQVKILKIEQLLKPDQSIQKYRNSFEYFPPNTQVSWLLYVIRSSTLYNMIA